MRRGATLRSLAARLRKLGDAAGMGRSCPRCRLDLRSHFPERAGGEEGEEEDGEVLTHCHFCGRAYVFSESLVPEGERDALRLYLSYGLEDFYTDPKAHALHLWVARRPWAELFRVPEVPAWRGKSPEVLLHWRLQEEAKRLAALKHKAMEARHGAQFPEHLELLDSIASEGRPETHRGFVVRGLDVLARIETGIKQDSALERIVWGRPRRETTTRLREVRRWIKALLARADAAIDEKARQEEEEEQTRRLLEEEWERLEKERQEGEKVPHASEEPETEEGSRTDADAPAAAAEPPAPPASDPPAPSASPEPGITMTLSQSIARSRQIAAESAAGRPPALQNYTPSAPAPAAFAPPRRPPRPPRTMQECRRQLVEHERRRRS